MEILRKATRLEVKRAFVTAQLIRKMGKNRYMPRVSRDEYLKRVRTAKKKCSKYSESHLNKIIRGEWEKRLKAYNAAKWHFGRVSVGEIGVWRGAGGLPREWTFGSLKQTAMRVARGLKKKDKHIRARSRRAIPGILLHREIILREPALSLIVFEGGKGTNGRKGMRRMKGDIDDGCMRSIALTIGGEKNLPAYIGTFPKRKNR